jgi:small subunit ribosomal protein S1
MKGQGLWPSPVGEVPLRDKSSPPSEPRETMAQLLQAGGAYRYVRRGELVEGVVVGRTREGVLVDVGAKTEGLIPYGEMTCLGPQGAEALAPGQRITAYVLRTENAEGQAILSLDRARGEEGWRLLEERFQRNEAFQAPVVGHNRGGLILSLEGVRCFLPASQMVAAPERSARESLLPRWVGKVLTVKVLEINRKKGRVIVSEKAAQAEQRQALLQELAEGQVRMGRIINIRDFGVFVDLGGVEGLVPLSELSWGPGDPPPQVGDQVQVMVTKVDQETGRISLSLRRAQAEAWEALVAAYQEGDVVPGVVTKLTPFGAFVRVEGKVEGLIHISELSDHHLEHPGQLLHEGEVVPVKILRIERDRCRLSLSLKQARTEAEAHGWVFDQTGAVIFAPPEVRGHLGGSQPPD